MKSIFSFSAFALLLLSANGCKPAKGNASDWSVSASGPIVERSYKIGKFSSLNVSCGITVDVMPGSNQSLTISAPEDLFEYLCVDNEGSTLVLGYKQGVNTHKHIKVIATLTTPQLNDIMATTSSVVNVNEPLKAGKGNVVIGVTTSATVNIEQIEADDVQINSTTSGVCSIQTIDADDVNVSCTTSSSTIIDMLKCNDLVATSTTSGSCTVLGEANNVKLMATTSGNINARSLISKERCKINVTTGANIYFDIEAARKNGTSVETSKGTGGSIRK